MLTPTGPESPVQRKSAIHRLLERWRVRRERIKRLNAARSTNLPSDGPFPMGGGGIGGPQRHAEAPGQLARGSAGVGQRGVMLPTIASARASSSLSRAL